MDTEQVIRSQYCAALEMLKQAVDKCPDSLWNAPEDLNKFWHVAYHALFYTHLYLQENEKVFTPWPKHTEGYESLSTPAENITSSYSKEEILEYLAVSINQTDEKITPFDFDAPSGFFWLPFNRLALHFYNIRHIQQHTGELYERLGTKANIELNWIS